MMRKYCWWFLFCVISIFCAECFAQDVVYPTLNNSWSYCFEYTWLGPLYDSMIGYNGTCDDYKDEFRAGDDIPCSSPLVISNDGTIPDVEYLWQNHRASVLCRRAESQACVTYTYWYNGLITNQTHMCARIRTDTGKIPSECYKQTMDGYEVEVCICKSGYGFNRMPCNSDATANKVTLSLILLTLLVNLFVKLI